MIFDSKTEEVAEGWEKLYNEHQNLYSLPIIFYGVNSRRIKCTLSLERIRKEIHTNRILAGKPKRRRKFGRP
jgi:hypothetical protein